MHESPVSPRRRLDGQFQLPFILAALVTIIHDVDDALADPVNPRLPCVYTDQRLS
jgi:hypothetical protein